jgi:cytochrome b involved in lipid metabolism
MAGAYQYSDLGDCLTDFGIGKDATDAFEDVGHSDEAREILAGLIKGELERRVHSPLLTQVLTFQTGDPIPSVKEAANQIKGAVQQQGSSATYTSQSSFRLLISQFPHHLHHCRNCCFRRL